MSQNPGEPAEQTGKYVNLKNPSETINIDKGKTLPPGDKGDTEWQWVGPKDPGK